MNIPHPLCEMAHKMSIEDRGVTHIKTIDGKIYKFNFYQHMTFGSRNWIAASCEDKDGKAWAVGVANIYKKYKSPDAWPLQ